MSRFFSLPLRTQLFLMALIVALPAASIIVASGLDRRTDAINEALRETRQLADTIASEQQIRVAAAEQLASALAQLPDIRENRTEQAQAILSDILRTNPQYLNIFIADHDGTMWVSARPSHATISIADRRHFINARSTGRFSSGEYIVGRLLNKPVLSFGYPYRNRRGKFAGVIVINFDLEHFRDLLQQSKLPAGSGYLIIDHKGVILSSGLDPAEFVGKSVNPRLLKQMKDGPDGGRYTGPGVDGVERFSCYRKLYLTGENEPYLYLRAGIPVREAASGATRDVIIKVAILTSFLFFAFLLAWLVGKRSIVNRIAILKNVSQRLAGGDLQARVNGLVTGGELGELGSAFDEMADKLSRQFVECRQAEAARRESELFLQTIIDAEPECVKMLAPDGRLLMMNPAGLAMIEADSFDQVKGEVVYPLIAPEHRDAFRAVTEGVFQGRENCLEFEVVGIKGHRRWLETHAVPLRDAQGKIVSLLAITRDISSRKRAERKIENLNAKLAARASELENANKELEAFGYTVSHDLRTPLTRISLICQILLESQSDDLEPRCQKYLDEIFLETQRMDQLISSLMEFSHIAHRDLVWESVNLSDMAQGIAAELSLNAPPRQVRFTIAQGISARGDAVLLRDALANLMGNAWKYTGKRESAVIEFGVTEVGGEQTYFVRDNGVGFDMSHAGRLFAAFQRLHDRNEYDGHGIGLATVKRIIDRLGGRVWAEGEPGKGATFYFTL